jgi:hypothetical protein
MNEFAPTSTQPVDDAPYHDRSTGLMVFGVLTLLLGLLSALMAVVMVGSFALISAGPNPQQVTVGSMLPAIGIYGGLAVVLVWLGVGSIKARRWARALLLVFSWSWLIVGVLDVGMMAYILPKVMGNLPSPGGTGRAAIPAGELTFIIGFTMLFSGFFLIVLPAIWTFFYSSRHVKLTCEWRDPVVRWTDACPLPVLGLCLWLAVSAISMVGMAAMPYLAAPFFGMFLSGVAARGIFLLFGGCSLYAAGLLYRLDMRGWWLALGTWVLFMLSSIITYSQHDILEVYRLMHYPDAQVAQIQKTGLLDGHTMVWFTPICTLPLLGYLFFIRRCLR